MVGGFFVSAVKGNEKTNAVRLFLTVVGYSYYTI